jgi:hypothetical protein
MSRPPLLAAFVLVPLFTLGEETSTSLPPDSGFRSVRSLPELRECLTQDGQKIRLEPGVYSVTTAEADGKTVFAVSGSNNTFDLRGVTLQVDTALLAKMKARTHELAAYRITGNGNTFLGGTFENLGEQPPSTSLSEFHVTGDGNTFQDCTFIIRGSAPYGYGDLLGKGRKHTVYLQKHSAMGILGDDTRILGCRFFIHTFGHAIHMHGAQNTLVKDTAIEGALRPSDEILAEKKGPAFENGFRNIYGQRLSPGLRVCLAEDGIRAYLEGERDEKKRRTGDITVEGCTVKRMRGGISLALASGKVAVRNCTATESGYPGHAYALPSEALVRDSRGDAAFAPLLWMLYSEKRGADIELELLEAPRSSGNDLLALINGSGHRITLTAPEGRALDPSLHIACGHAARLDGEDAGQAFAKSIRLLNQNPQPVLLDERTSECEVRSVGPVTDRGSGNRITLSTP